jgi:PAS domain S-box-containing protein
MKQTAVSAGGAADTWRALADSLPLCAYVTDPRGRCLAVSRALADWLGRSAPALAGLHESELWPTPLAAGCAEARRRVLAGEHLDTEEVRPRRGSFVPVRSIRLPLTNAPGTVQGVLNLFWEITSISGLQTIGRLAGGIVHDFSNLVTTMLCSLPLLQTATGLTEQQQRTLDLLRGTAEQTARLNGQLRALLRGERQTAQVVDVNAAVRDLMTIVERAFDPRILVRTRLAPNLPSVRCDPVGLTRALLNLCWNARDAMPHGGRLLLETEADDGWVRLSIIDSGPGISADVRTRIFEAGFTTRPADQGCGLGLAIVKELVGRDGGQIECFSCLGQGTQFRISLPASEDQPQPAKEVAPLPQTDSGRTVLFADDERSLRHLARVVLESNGYEVLLAEDGRQAIELFQRERARIALVMLDLDMPFRTGLEALAAMAAIDPGVTALLMTGHGPPTLPPELAAHVRGVLTKPFGVDQLLRAIQGAPPGG